MVEFSEIIYQKYVFAMSSYRRFTVNERDARHNKNIHKKTKCTYFCLADLLIQNKNCQKFTMAAEVEVKDQTAS